MGFRPNLLVRSLGPGLVTRYDSPAGRERTVDMSELKEKLKLPAASGGESSICREETSYIRSLNPGQAPGNALAVRFKGLEEPIRFQRFHLFGTGARDTPFIDSAAG
jgi:hypothetical protein